MPTLDRLAARMPGLAVVFVSVDDEPGSADTFLQAQHLAPRVGKTGFVFDEGRKLLSSWKPTRMPTTYLLDASNVVRFVHEGFVLNDETVLEIESAQLSRP